MLAVIVLSVVVLKLLVVPVWSGSWVDVSVVLKTIRVVVSLSLKLLELVEFCVLALVLALLMSEEPGPDVTVGELNVTSSLELGEL